MKFYLLFLLILTSASLRASAEEAEEKSIEGHPGWTLELIKPEPNEDGSPNYRTAYFVLKPPDKRPAASISSRLAGMVRGGEIGPEAAYEGGNAETSSAGKNSKSSGGSEGFSALPMSGSPSPVPADAPKNSAALPVAGTGSSPSPVAPPAATPANGANSSGSSKAPGSSGNSSASPISYTLDNTKHGTVTSAIAIAMAGQGLVADLFDGDGQQFHSINDYVTKGKKTDGNIYFTQLNIPARDFSSGFQSQNGSTLKTSSGGILTEWFALVFTTVLRLTTTDTPGQYQFMLESDDGSILSQQVGNQWQVVINNDGTHGCQRKIADVPVTLDRASALPLKIEYYQGPRTGICLSMYWRKWGSLDDWKIVPTKNYWLPPGADPKNVKGGDIIMNPLLN